MFNIILQKSVLTHLRTPLVNVVERRNFFYWIDVIFNRVNKSRVRKFGPDRVCSEWLLRNGAAVKWLGRKDFTHDYNSLPSVNSQFFIQAVDATESDIHDIGFYHFDGCQHIEEVKIIRCKKVTDTGLPLLAFLKDSLQHLEIQECKSITHNSLCTLSKLQNLKTLKISELPYVENKDELLSHLKKNLPNCEICFE